MNVLPNIFAWTKKECVIHFQYIQIILTTSNISWIHTNIFVYGQIPYSVMYNPTFDQGKLKRGMSEDDVTVWLWLPFKKNW